MRQTQNIPFSRSLGRKRQSKEEAEVDGIDIAVFLMNECIPFALQLSTLIGKQPTTLQISRQTERLP
jgi:hypothetical protein